MKPESIGEDGGEKFARAVARAVNEGADRYLRARHGYRLPFGPVAMRLTRERRQRRTRYVALTTTMGCAAVAGVLGLWARPKPDTRAHETLTYTVDGDPPPQGGYIAPASSSEPVLSFSDGTRVRLAGRARGRVVNLNRHGARIALDEGNANVEVAHRPGAEWFFEAGPFVITVHGTAFSFGWSSRNARLEVKMRSGVVSVTGPLSGEEIVLRAGQSLSLSLNDQGAPAPDAITGPVPELGPPAPAALRASAPAGAGRPLDTRRVGADWGTRLAEGQASGIVAEARRLGLSKVLQVSSSEDLAALADAARFERDERLARRALLSQRRRFPGSGRAAEASFLLGRLDDAENEDSAHALGWYDRYLNEAPGGAYVSEALGRKMTVLERSGRQAEATRIARDYLQRFPSGTYSRAAQALVHES
jgi:FecR protein